VSGPPRVHILTLGCPKNEADSRAIARDIASGGYDIVDDPDAADVLVVNTCAFVADAVEESVDTLLEAVEAWRPASPGRRVLAIGCLPSRYGADVESELPEVDAFVPVARARELLPVLSNLVGEGSAPRPPASHDTSWAYLSVSDGCDRTCTFCTIPSIRGPHRSRPAADVLGDARSLLAAGARELVCVGQDIAVYRDSDGSDLTELVRELSRLAGLTWLRLMYVQPDGVTDRLLEVVAESETVCDYLDIPVQHASRDVLRRMGRGGDASSLLSLVDRIRTAVPGVALRTTIMAGFPGETEADVDVLEEFLEEARFEHVGVFAFSAEEGTPAAGMADCVPNEVALERARSLSHTADAISEDVFRGLVGSTLLVLSDGFEDTRPVGRWHGQAPGIDGVVYLDDAVPAGGTCRARIEDIVGHDLIARIER
jgi:ribosomal protein S12 methylthiotransferase